MLNENKPWQAQAGEKGKFLILVLLHVLVVMLASRPVSQWNKSCYVHVHVLAFVLALVLALVLASLVKTRLKIGGLDFPLIYDTQSLIKFFKWIDELLFRYLSVRNDLVSVGCFEGKALHLAKNVMELNFIIS